jgi:hypothetical protein
MRLALSCLGAICSRLVFLLLPTAGLSPDQAQTRQENWGGVLQEVALPNCHGTADFLRQAVDFANNRCWGTLAAR